MAGRLILPPSLPSAIYRDEFKLRRPALVCGAMDSLDAVLEYPTIGALVPVAKQLVQTVGARAASQVVTRLAGGVVNKAWNYLSTPSYAPQKLTFKQFRLPQPQRMRRYVRRRRRFGNRRRRRFGRRRFAKRRVIVNRIASANHETQSRFKPTRHRVRSGFVSRVRYALMRLQPVALYTYQTNDSISGTANQDSIFSVMAGGMTVTNQDEIFQAFNCAYNLAGVVASAKPYKLYIRNICLDIQITNFQTFPIVVDVYRLGCRRTYSTADTVHAQLTTAWSEIASDPSGGTVTTTKPTLTSFDAPNLLNYWKIWSKQTSILLAGNTISMQIRLRKAMMVDGKLFGTNPQAIPGYTQAYLFIVRGSPQDTAGTGNLGAPKFVVSSQRTLHYAIPPGFSKEVGKTA